MLSNGVDRFSADLLMFENAHEVQVRTDDGLPLIVTMEHNYALGKKSRTDIVTWVFDLPYGIHYPVVVKRLVNRDGLVMPVDEFNLDFEDYRGLPLGDFTDSINYGDENSFDRASYY